MRKTLLTLACATALATVPLAGGVQEAQAQKNIIGAIIGGAIAGAVIGSVVRAGQNHCHEGLGCHSHGYADANHYHQAYGGPILYYQQPAPPPPPTYVAPPPPPPQGGGDYVQLHYQWCFGKYKSYDQNSNTYQPFGAVPRRPCVSPYGR